MNIKIYLIISALVINMLNTFTNAMETNKETVAKAAELFNAITKVNQFTAQKNGNQQTKEIEEEVKKNYLKIISLVQENQQLADEYYNGVKPIHLACAYGNENLTRFLRAYGANINSLTKTADNIPDMHPLHIAAMHGDVKFFKYLIELGAQLTFIDANNNPQPLTDIKGYNVLHIAAANGHSELVKYLINSGFDPILEVPNLRFENLNLSAFEIAQLESAYKSFKNNDVENYKKICDILINAPSNTGLTLLHNAIQKESEQRVAHLIQHGASIDQKQETKWALNYVWLALSRGKDTPSSSTKFDDRFTILATILEAGGNPDSIHPKTKLSCLADAIINNFPLAVQTLLYYKANPNLKTDYGTPLRLAITVKNLEIIKLLLKAGAETNTEGETVGILNYALYDALNDEKNNEKTNLDMYIEIVSLLLDKGANPNITHNGLIPLDMAIILKNKNLISLLIDQPIDREGSTHLHKAVSNKDVSKVNLLINNGANCQRENIAGISPLKLCKSTVPHDKIFNEIYHLLAKSLTRR